MDDLGGERALTIQDVRKAALNARWAMTRHARERVGKRRIGDEGLIHALAEGEILEAYPEDPRGPSALVLGYTEDGSALHAICALDPSGTLVVITVYEPQPPKWADERSRGTKGGER